MSKQIRPYGTWPSPVSPEMLSSTLRLSDAQWDTDGETLVWLEGRGAQGVLVMQRGTDAAYDLAGELSVRGRVGYGGGDFTVSHGMVYFAGPEGRLYRQALAGGNARAITPAFGSAASPRVSADGKWLVFVHTDSGVDTLGLVDVNGDAWPAKLASGTDFVMQPAWHPQGKYLAYIAWNHPQMPWDGTELRLISFDYAEGVPGVTDNKIVAGNETTAIFQPEFSPDGRYLAYVSDASGWGQLYVYDLEANTHRCLTDTPAEHGLPAWQQAQRMFGWSHDSKSIFFLRNNQAVVSLWRCELESGQEQAVSGLDEYTYLAQPAISPVQDRITLLAGSSTIPTRVITYSLADDSLLATLDANAPTVNVLVPENEDPGERIYRRSSGERLLPEQLSTAESISWTGYEGGTVYGQYYPPTNADFEGTGQPPLIVDVHGGPTGQSFMSYRGGFQFFTSRGFAVLDVNYRGSTGYGKDYMNKLRESWGIYDVQDCASGASYLVDQGLADGNKLVIMGGSAGGFTVLQSLIEKPGFYKAGISSYGVANHFLLAMETHKFEERYTDSMLGPLPQAAQVYRDRSPYFHADKIKDPIAVFQGEDDPVVLRNQSDDIVASLRRTGTPHEYHVYAGEGHGWRKPETIQSFYKSVLKFLMQYVVFA